MAEVDAVARRLGLNPDERYEVEEQLGEGGYGRVVGARDRHLQRSVAIKVIDVESEEAQAFLAEAVVAGRLEHPNIVPTYDVGLSDELGVYYTMKRFGGRTLKDVLVDPDVSQRRLLDAFTQVCRAVAYAHERGVVHTDLKPENVLLGERNEVQVADWGLAIVVDGQGVSHRPEDAFGTPRYMAPEQITDDVPLDERADVWSLGVMLYEMLTRRVPFDGVDEEEILEAVLSDVPVSPSARVASVPKELSAICLRALEKSRTTRYPTVNALLDDLEAFLDGRRDAERRERIAKRAAAKVTRALADAEVLADFERIVGSLRTALEVAPGHSALVDRAGEAYWRIFQEIYPGGRAGPEDARRALALLGTLAENALVGVVRAGPDAFDAGGDDPWLTLVRRLRDGAEVSAADAPEALRTIVGRIELLADVPLFASLGSHELLTVADACREVAVAGGATLFHAGDEGTALYVVAEGALRAEKDGTPLSTMRAGEVFGEVAVFGARRRTASVVAEEDSVCLALDADRFAELVRTHGAIGLAILKVLSLRLERATQREAALRSASGRGSSS